VFPSRSQLKTRQSSWSFVATVCPLANPRHKEHHNGALNTALRIVEGSSMDKTKALSAALSQIERQFGKGR